MCQFDHSRPTGTRMVGVIQFISTLLTLIWLFASDFATYTYSSVESCLVILVYVFTILQLLMAFLLIFATVETDNFGNILPLRIWLGWTGFCGAYLIFSTIALLFISFANVYLSYGRAGPTYTLNVMSLVLLCYFFFIVFSYYENVLEKRNNFREKPSETDDPSESDNKV